jgi:hypothetical protein
LGVGSVVGYMRLVGGRLNKEMREVAICGEGDVHTRRTGKDWGSISRIWCSCTMFDGPRNWGWETRLVMGLVVMEVDEVCRMRCSKVDLVPWNLCISNARSRL